MKIFQIILTFMLAWSVTGCDQLSRLIAHKEQKETQTTQSAVIQMVDNPQLAQMILKPKQERIVVSRDPFKPVTARSVVTAKVIDQGADDLVSGMEYLGVVRVGERYSALLKSNQIKGVFSVHDRISQLTVVDIQEDFVMLNNGTKSYKIKRGVK
ncbi:MAG TPA: hypothetical protein DD723_03180 [Candidatus Omnitrophica bacterium]|nr:MAG: hypothetical protein A2Z81_01095 [Omnitrophica WOR_2 bacterium GWA2_45_18]OGX19259.1 MAG: hypothetical protein A2Y04_00230 [Omnitrophica WOR_2 bacterium GWC2_45_7]HBR14532.1 hypothetical protein [Candidatus Omnitrophota bacterium]